VYGQQAYSNMVFSALSAVVLGLVASTLAYPGVTSNTAYQLAQMEELRVETENFLDTYPKDRMVAMQRAVSSVTVPLLAGCEDVFMIFTRGTFEPAFTANMGMVVGIPFLNMLKSVLKKSIGADGVDYNNSVMGYMTGGDGPGSTKMAEMISAKAAQCPKTKLIVSGYSQGAQVTHNALNSLGDSVKSHIAGVVVFGDPNKGKAIKGISADKIYTNCNDSDPICKGVPVPLGTHLTYGTDTVKLKEVAEWVKGKVE